MKAIVCGGRKYEDKAYLFEVLDRSDITFLIEGGAEGADRLARQWAQENDIPFHTEEAEWERFGKSAGRIRNSKMADMEPDVVIAFPGGSGTEHMKGVAMMRGIDLLVM